ncbi:ankyrin repeat domain-containing protein SOWAHC [Ctenodactylus gundi]
MEGPGPEEVLRFLAERGGRVRHAELVQYFRGALGGEPEERARARARFKELVNAVATVRTDPVDGTKYVHLKKRFLSETPSDPPRVEVTADPKDLLPGDPPLIEVTRDPEDLSPGNLPLNEVTRDAEDLPQVEVIADLGERPQIELTRDSEAAFPGDPPSVEVTVDPGAARRKSSGLSVGEPEPQAPGGEDADGAGGLGAPATPRPARHSLRALVMGSSPQAQPRRSAVPGGSNSGSAPGGGRGRGGGDSDSASVASSSAEEEGGGGGGAVALDPLEHAWMLSAADGRWDSLEGLLACDPGLLVKRDFITGFTCLHWAAKHGRQELLATLVRFAGQHGLPVNINARTSGGYTALHLAAMHGHVEVVKLLVGAYDADVEVRDYSGRKAAQYLSRSVAEEIRSLVGALDEEDEAEGPATGKGGRWRLSRVLPAHLVTYRLSHVLEEGGDHHHHHLHLAEGWTGGKAKERKASGSSGGRMKPRLHKIRFRTQVIHDPTSSRDPEQPLEEGEEEEERFLRGHSSSFKLRPKSNVFG